MANRRSGQETGLRHPTLSGAPALRTPPAPCHVGPDPVGPPEIARPVKQPASCDMTNRREASREILGPRGSRGAAVDRPLAGGGDIRLRNPIGSVPEGGFSHTPRGPADRTKGPAAAAEGCGGALDGRRRPSVPQARAVPGGGGGPPRPAAGPPCPDRRRDRDRRPLTPPPPGGVGPSAQRSMLTRGISDVISPGVSRPRLTGGDGSVRVASRRFGQVQGRATRPSWPRPPLSCG
jgi:hypothetical protein